MAAKDYYEILGVARDAGDDAIRKAYKELARKYHPDVNPGDKQAEARFKDVAEAYAVLKDPKKRRQYDTGGPEGFSSGFDASEIFQRARGGFDPFDLTSLFEMFTGGGGAGGARVRMRPARGADLQASLPIDFVDAIRGVTLPLTLGDRGSITVRIPAGVSDGSRLRIPGKGDPGPGGGPPGDLYVRIGVRNHPLFRRDGDALICQVPLTLTEAALGARVKVPTLDGETTMTVPAGTRSGQRFRIRGKGVPRPGGETGPLYVDVQIVPPAELDDESRRMLEEFARRNPQPGLREHLRTKS